MTEMALTRSRAKHPPDKTVAEARRTRSKVEKSNTKRRKNMKTTEVARRQAELGYTLRLTDDGGHWEWVGREQARRDAAIFQKLTADLPKMERFIEDLDREAAINNTGTPEMRMSGAKLLDRDAIKLTQGDDAEDYPSAVRQAVGGVNVEREDDVLVREMGRVYDGGEDELRAAVERRMQADPENYER